MALEPQINYQLYKVFGLADYVKKLVKDGKEVEVKKIEEIISSFILAQSLMDLNKEQREALNKQDFTDAQALYDYFENNIDNYQERLKAYGRVFRTTILPTIE